jgi:tRNA(Ile)-lysidine synthase
MARRIPNSHLAFTQKFIRELKSLPIPPRKILVAVSGGVDSVGLFLVLKEVQTLFKMNLVVAHVHHGQSSSSRQNQFRLKAMRFVKDLCDTQSTQFITNTQFPTRELKSEAELRAWRFHWLNQWASEHGVDAIALGHHQEDLLETQMMRLMRGSSGLGLGAMQIHNSQSKRLRPFLHFSKNEIENFVQSTGTRWITDPSNQKMGPLRNRVRVWLNEMESFYPGSKSNLLKSLHRVVSLHQEVKFPWKERVMTKSPRAVIKRQIYLGLSEPFKRELLAQYLRECGVKEFTSGQVIELMKRLDVLTNDDTFTFFGRCWTLSPEVIQVGEGR